MSTDILASDAASSMSTSPKPKKLKSPKRGKSPTRVDTIIHLQNINMTELDKEYVLPEIAKKQDRESKKSQTEKAINLKAMTTSLTKLGISSSKKDSSETIVWGDKLNINIFINKTYRQGDDRYISFLLDDNNFKCSWCHNFPPEGTRCLAVPIKYTPASVDEQVYNPDCVNIVEDIDAKKSIPKKTTAKNTLKINFFKRNVPSFEKGLYKEERLSDGEYFESSHPVCSFNCIAEGSLVNLAHGDKIPIEDLVHNTKDVLAWDSVNKQIINAQQTAFFNQGMKECIELKFNNTSLVCTPDHRILKTNGQWTAAKDLIKGDIVVSVNQSIFLSAEDAGIRKVYDLGVISPYYSFMANDVMVHNCMISKGRELALVDPRYKNCDMLIYYMYEKIFNKLPDEALIPASSFMILKDYGGDYTLEEYRQAFKFLFIEETKQFYFNKLVRPATMLFATESST